MKQHIFSAHLSSLKHDQFLKAYLYKHIKAGKVKKISILAYSKHDLSLSKLLFYFKHTRSELHLQTRSINQLKNPSFPQIPVLSDRNSLHSPLHHC